MANDADRGEPTNERDRLAITTAADTTKPVGAIATIPILGRSHHHASGLGFDLARPAYRLLGRLASRHAETLLPKRLLNHRENALWAENPDISATT